jgi:GNAT superfamily N-acetyltransferase
MYPKEMIHQMEMPEDVEGIHFGAFTEDKLAGVISLFSEGTIYQFRKFAVDNSMQGKGIGSKILQYVIDFAKAEGGTRIWCNARITAINFYAKFGFTATGQRFSRKGIDYEIFERALK